MLLNFVSKQVVTYARSMDQERVAILKEATNELPWCHNCALPVTKNCKTAIRCKCASSRRNPCAVLFCKQTTSCAEQSKWYNCGCGNCDAKFLKSHAHFNCVYCGRMLCDDCTIKCDGCNNMMCKFCRSQINFCRNCNRKN
jgi:hypothetical protein